MVVKGHTQTYGVDHLETSLVASLNFIQICFLLAFLWLKGNMSLIFCSKLISSWVLMLLIILWALLLNLILCKDNYILMSVDTGAWLGSWFILLLLVLKFFMPLLCLVNIYMLPVSLIMKPFSYLVLPEGCFWPWIAIWAFYFLWLVLILTGLVFSLISFLSQVIWSFNWGNLIICHSEKYNAIECFHVETEYRAIVHASSEMLWVHSLIQDIDVDVPTRLLLCGCVMIIKEPFLLWMVLFFMSASNISRLTIIPFRIYWWGDTLSLPMFAGMIN